jgi:hypothetical protein
MTMTARATKIQISTAWGISGITPPELSTFSYQLSAALQILPATENWGLTNENFPSAHPN